MKSLLVLICFCFNCFAQIPDSLLPKHSSSDFIIHHLAYTVDFDKSKGIAKWSAYLLTRSMVENKVAVRSNKFKADPLAGQYSPEPCSYKHSGYDKGHLAPAADMAWSVEAMQESFYMTNMTPQVPAFNRGIWKQLEDRIRVWAEEYDSLYVITGPIMDSSMEKLPACGGGVAVSIPQTFFKVVLSNKKGHEKAIGFIFPNEGSKKLLKDFAFPVDWVEYCSHLDFFPTINDSIENKIGFDIR